MGKLDIEEYGLRYMPRKRYVLATKVEPKGFRFMHNRFGVISAARRVADKLNALKGIQCVVIDTKTWKEQNEG